MLVLDHVRIVKRGNGDFAKWRGEFPAIQVNLHSADLRETSLPGIDLHGADLSNADLDRANLSGANLERANLEGASLRETNLRDAILRHANLADADFQCSDRRGSDAEGTKLLTRERRLSNLMGVDRRNRTRVGANLQGANLAHANLCNASMRGSNLRGANLTGANLTGADLGGANLEGANLTGAILIDTVVTKAECAGTIFVNLDLRHVHGLEALRHRGDSHVGIDTLLRSGGEIPETFLERCGVMPTRAVNELLNEFRDRRSGR